MRHALAALAYSRPCAGIVRHFQLPGKIPSGDSVEHVIMHVFIKALQISDGVAFRGAPRLWTSLSSCAQMRHMAHMLLVPELHKPCLSRLHLG